MTPKGGIPEFYKNRDIFITGVTGFVGKVLLEKLLRSCDVRRIFALVRPKKGLDPETRRNALLKSKMFEKLRERKPQVFSKVHFVQGNLLEEDLGLDAEDKATLTENVSVVFHLAASVKFIDTLRDSFYNNVQATKRVADLCRQMTQLAAFVHVSTAYCNCEKSDVEEKIYPLSITYDSTIALLQSNDDIFIEKVTPALLEGKPNVYTLTKAITESMLAEKYSDLPLVIVRPSMISAAWKEPLPGWVDSMNGPIGLFVGAMTGIIRTMLVHGEKVADLIPVDIVVNMLLAAAWNLGSNAKSGFKEIEVYHCCSGTVNKITWNYLMTTMYPLVWRYPSQKVFIYPGGSFKRSPLWNDICIALVHYFPACMGDLISYLIGKPPRLMKLYSRMHKAMKVLCYFATREWRFHSDNGRQLLLKMSQEDTKNFDFDMANFNWEEYLKDTTFGTRRYVLKEDDSTIPEARRNIRRNYYISLGVRTAIVLGIVHCFFNSQFASNFLY